MSALLAKNHVYPSLSVCDRQIIGTGRLKAAGLFRPLSLFHCYQRSERSFAPTRNLHRET
jgi:hypothetical protein